MKEKRPYPLRTMPASLCKSLQYLFTDIDDTLTENGILPAESFSAIWELFNNGIRVIPVTGRPAGWCDFIARMWPVEGVLGENGAFFFSYDRIKKKMERRYLLSEEERLNGIKKLEKIKKRILKEVPECQVACDQAYRITDLAIDYCEDINPPPGKESIKKIVSIITQEGANYKISSIHVNCWYGDFNKLKCLKLFLQEKDGRDYKKAQNRIIYIGDSPNDEPIFKDLEFSIGVANLRKYLMYIKALPLYITESESSKGFCEAVKTIIEKKNL